MREFNTRVAEGGYYITFETDDRKAYEQVQSLCRLLVDGKDGEAIPIEWIENKLKCCDNINAEIFVKALMREWENREWPQ